MSSPSPTAESCQNEDAELALAICRADGVNGLRSLEGDFALACFDGKSNRLMAIRDPLGGYPIFWARQGETVSLSTSIRPLIDLPNYIEGDGILDYDDQERLPLIDEPFAMSCHFKFNEGLVLAAAQAGADTILGGEGGDQLFDLPMLFLITDLLHKRDVRGALALARRYGRARSEGPWRILWNAARLLLPTRARDGVRPFLAGGRAPFENQSERTLPPWFIKEFARRNRLQARAMTFQPSRSESHLFNSRDIAFSVGEWYRWYIGSPHGINITHPFWDTRVISLVLGLPKIIQASPEQSKPVLAAAVSDLLPQKIVRRSRKSHFGELLAGYARHQGALERLIMESPVDQEMIDKSILLDCLRKAALGLFGQGVGVARLRITLSYLSWLSNMNAWQKARVPTFPLRHLMPTGRVESASESNKS